jgi:hypothetical protein
MIFTNLILSAIFVVMIGAVAFGAYKVFKTYQRYRGKRLVTCPETHKAAAVHINAGKAAREAFLGREDVRLDQCSRWPERQGCGQECLSQVHADPEQCLVWNIVTDWYKGKTCAYCQRPFTDFHWHEHHPAVLSPERVAKQWNEIPPEKLPEVFQTHLPVCWNCFIAETYRKQNADRVVNRGWERGAGGEYVPKEEETAGAKKSTGAEG